MPKMIIDDDDEDPVIYEAPIYFSNALYKNLVLFQFPTLPNEPYFPPDFSLTQRYKPKNRIFEFDIPIETDGNQMYDFEKGKDLQSKLDDTVAVTAGNGRPRPKLFDRMTYSSQHIPTDSLRYFAVIKRNDRFYFNFVSEIFQMRPSMKYLDDIELRAKAMQKRLAADEDSTASERGPSTDSKLLQVEFRRKETEEEMDARLRSFAHYQKLIQNEPWKPLTYFAYGTEESCKVFDKLFQTKTDTWLVESNEDAVDFFNRTFPDVEPRLSEDAFKMMLKANPASITFSSISSAKLSQQVLALLVKMSIFTTGRLFELLSITDSTQQSAACQELEKNAFLIGGRWIVKSETSATTSSTKQLIHARNILLWMFHCNNDFVTQKEFVDAVNVGLEDSIKLLSEISIKTVRDGSSGWMLKGSKDEPFLSKNPGLVSRQLQLLSEATKPSLQLAGLSEDLADVTCVKKGRKGKKPL